MSWWRVWVSAMVFGEASLLCAAGAAEVAIPHEGELLVLFQYLHFHVLEFSNFCFSCAFLRSFVCFGILLFFVNFENKCSEIELDRAR